MTALVAAPCVLAVWLHVYAESYRYDPLSRWGWWNHHEGDAAAWAIPLALVVALGSLGLGALAGRFNRHAARPLPAPAVDPLATYREGAVTECPRHPFAK
ncbi:MAG: hypothetical protein Q8S73_24260 [Deltaproteobacteria bacterium]|nr:hypothetical protein [Myxococcales bacterium]MDP3217248.1 hypothetical protein [Deltaproteobacteria bacterium]